VATIAEVYALALQTHQAGHLQQAEQLYLRILQAVPEHAAAHHSLGVLAYQTGRCDLALASIRQAVHLQPTVAGYHSNLGLAYETLGRLGEAIAEYQWAIQLQPDSADAHNNLANVLRRLGRLDEAVTHCRQALRIRPEYPEAYNNLASALLQLGQTDEAIVQFRQALQLKPSYPEAHSNLGLALSAKNLLDQAIGHYQQALRLNPDSAEAHNNMGSALVSQGKPAQAEIHCRHALRIRPDYSEAFNNLGNALQDQRKLPAAVDCYREALRFNPKSPEAHYNLGNALREMGNLDEAGDWFQKALRLRPQFPFALNNLGNVFLKQGRLDQAIESFQRAVQLEPDFVLAQSNYLFCLNYDPEADPDTVFAEHRRWGQSHGQTAASGGQPDGSAASHANDPDPERRLRIGYVSPDLRYHAVTRYFEPVLAHHDPRQVEVFCYAEMVFADKVTERLQKFAHQWRWICRKSDEQVAARIREDRIDILVDLAGHTAGNRLCVFALKPAPVQATWLGYLNTTGLKAIDYRITDDVLDPLSGVRCPESGVRSSRSEVHDLSSGTGLRTPDSGRIYDTEELFRLPDGMCCFAPDPDAPALTPPPACRCGYVTFGSMHSLFKLNARVFDLWSRVVHAVPSSRLLLFRDTLTATSQEYIRREFKDRGIENERLDLRKGTDAPGYLAVYEEIDVSLDTFPYSGGVITCESLWMGVPVLSLRGQRPAGRNSTALLARVGLADWAVGTPEEFVAAAARLPQELERLAQIRAELRERMTATLCDARRFTRGLEDAYRTMWRRWCEKVSNR
jgi:protein O-GlcNAc transferase